MLNYKKPGFWVMTSALVICLAIGICFLTNPKQTGQAATIHNKNDISVEQNAEIPEQQDADQEDQIDKVPEQLNAKKTVQHMDLELDNLHIDADYVIPEVYKDMKMNRIEAHLPEINPKKCVEAFGIDLSGTKKEVEKDFTSGNIGKYDVTSYYDPDPYDSNYTSYVEFNPFGSYGVGAGTRFDRVMPYVRYDKRFGSYNLDKFSASAEWPFISRAELFTRTKKALEEGLGITISDSYEGYALDYQTLKKEQEKNPELMGPVIEDWSEADNSYFFRFHQEIDGLPICQNGYGDMEDAGPYIDQTQLEVWYDKDGYMAYRANNVYIINKTHEKQTIIDIDQAIKRLKKQCGSKMDSTIKTNIDEIRLELMPVHIKDKDFEIRPVWAFYGRMDGYSYGYVEFLIDGITGEILYNSIP